MAVVGKKIIVFCDGTGNDIINSKYPTNISILHENLTRTDGDDIRAVLYFEGVGVSRDNTSVLLDSINANSLDYILMSAYIGIVSNYVPSDRIYLFGFSRGAFTVRCLYNFIFRYGILTKATHTAVKCLYSHYKNYNKSGVSTEQIELYPVHEHSRYTVDFLGLFDTVSGLSQKQEREHDFFLRADDNTTRFCHIMSMDVNFMYSNLSFFGQMKNVENSRNASRFAVVTVDRPYVRVDNTNAGFENFLLRPDQQHARNDLHFWLIPQYEMMYPGDHCSVGGGWEEFPRGVNRILSNYSLYFVARASRLRFDDIYNNADLNMHNEENEVVVATSYPASLDIAARLPAFANVFEQLTRSNSIFAFGSMRAYFMRFIGYRISQFCLFHLRGRIVYRVGRREGRYLDENLDPSFLNRLFMNIYNISGRFYVCIFGDASEVAD